MKNKLVATIALFAIGVLVCVSCNKDTQKSDVIQESSVENPFNFVGEVHNSGLDYVMSSLPETKSAVSLNEEIDCLANSFCDDLFKRDDRFSVVPMTKSGQIDSSSYNDAVELSSEASAYLDKIIEVANSGDYEYIKEKYSIFEEELLAEGADNFTEYENALLLCTIAVGKYSNEYWKDIETSTTKGLVMSLIAGDAIGAAKGIMRNALVIAVSGAIAGPAAMLASAGRAALLPAIRCSAEAAILYAASQY